MAFFQRQFCLSWSRSVAKDTATVNRQIELISDNPGDFRRLIETAFAQTVGVQRKRDDELIVRLQSRRKLVAQPAGNSQLMTVFEGVNDAINRKIITKSSNRPIKMRRILHAGTTTFPMSCLFATLRTTGRRQCREVDSALGAQQAALTIGATQQAAFWQQIG